MASERKGTLKIASIRGVDFNIHISLIFLLIYVVFVATMQFPLVARGAEIDPDLLTFSPPVWGMLFAGGLLLSVALHEWGHVFVAQAQGVKVKGITLMMLGGASEMEGMPEKPYAEFKLAVIGPIVSFAIGAALLFIRSRTESPDLAFYGYWLGTANVILGIFNLLPAFPLDGGRALRSLLAVKNGQVRATEQAVGVSRVFSWMLGIWGVLSFNIILILIAFFIYAISKSELLLLTTRQLLEGVRVSDVIHHLNPVDERANLRDAAERMLEQKTSVLPVITRDDGSALVTLARLRQFPREEWPRIAVRDALSVVRRTLSPEDRVSAVVQELLMAPDRTLPVQEAGRLIGVVSFTDLEQVMQFKSLEETSEQGKRAS